MPPSMHAPGRAQSRPHKGWHERGYLPHFDGATIVQTITFRLADSLPRAIVEEAAVASAGERRARIDAAIDAGRGACLLRDPGNAALVRDALRHFDGERYRLLAWVVMPNHVHAMIEQVDGHRLGDIVHSWKSFTAKAINTRRCAAGRVWAPDYFDRFVRDEAHQAAVIRYIEDNPVKAGLVGEASSWAYSSASGRDARAPITPGAPSIGRERCGWPDRSPDAR